MSDAEPAWRDETGQAGWIGEALARFDAYVVTSVAVGFESYAWVLHPAEESLHGGRVVRWAEVAAGAACLCGLSLRPGSQFHSIALPPLRRRARHPRPDRGYARAASSPDAAILAEILRDWMTTPQRCWFCVWDGTAGDRGVYLTASDAAILC